MGIQSFLAGIFGKIKQRDELLGELAADLTAVRQIPPYEKIRALVVRHGTDPAILPLVQSMINYIAQRDLNLALDVAESEFTYLSETKERSRRFSPLLTLLGENVISLSLRYAETGTPTAVNIAVDALNTVERLRPLREKAQEASLQIAEAQLAAGNSRKALSIFPKDPAFQSRHQQSLFRILDAEFPSAPPIAILERGPEFIRFFLTRFPTPEAAGQRPQQYVDFLTDAYRGANQESDRITAWQYFEKAVGSSEAKPQVVTDRRFAFASAMKDEDPRLPEAIEKWKSSFSALERNFVTYKNLLNQIQDDGNNCHLLTAALEQTAALQRELLPHNAVSCIQKLAEFKQGIGSKWTPYHGSLLTVCTLNAYDELPSEEDSVSFRLREKALQKAVRFSQDSQTPELYDGAMSRWEALLSTVDVSQQIKACKSMALRTNDAVSKMLTIIKSRPIESGDMLRETLLDLYGEAARRFDSHGRTEEICDLCQDIYLRYKGMYPEDERHVVEQISDTVILSTHNKPAERLQNFFRMERARNAQIRPASTAVTPAISPEMFAEALASPKLAP